MDPLDMADLSKAVEGVNLSNPLEDNNTAGKQKLVAGRTALGIAQGRIERKRLSDKAYRDRRKEERNKMQDELHKLTVENKHLKLAIQSLKAERHSMNLKLQSATTATKQLQNAVNKRRRQNVDAGKHLTKPKI
ncbi:uncharacterized protein LOC120006413 [Tripterygium wilfordii]|uniref:uncharacterized protein LOC120006413 n=1 Tax=Tripterygium wilfordii TaxID=458696 RepID=UPI0018F85C13|nr:uncharacterized protein LOC120006413 [Tripterygium wilfordii]